MGLSESFEGDSLMYINWQTAHHVGAARKKACGCEWAKETTEEGWHAGKHGVGGSEGRAVGGCAQELKR